MLDHGIGIQLKCRENVIFKLNSCFWTKFKANSMCLYFSPKRLLKKSMKIRLTWRLGKKCKIWVTIRTFKMEYIVAAGLEEQPFKNVLKKNYPQEIVVKFFEKYLRRRAIFSKFVCNVFLLLTTGTEELYLIPSFFWTPTFVKRLLLNYFCVLKGWGNFLGKYPE